jgi:hypothetical protein
MEQILKKLETIFSVLTLGYSGIQTLYMNLLLARKLGKTSNFNSAIN